MSFKSDIQIAREANKKPIQEIGEKLGIPSEHLLPYGHDKAKVSQAFIESVKDNRKGKLILVTAINPTPSHFDEPSTLATREAAIDSLSPASGMASQPMMYRSRPVPPKRVVTTKPTRTHPGPTPSRPSGRS